MGKDVKEDSGFGFKDKAKAEETLKLLEQHDMNYRRLTVRGLLGRAKRVLGLTKAAEKIKNIKEAMEVFETWLAEQSQGKEPVNKKEGKEKKEKKQDSDEKSSSDSDAEMAEKPKAKDAPTDTVPGLGFKDKETAESTLQELEGRDPDYQKLAIKGLIGRAKRVLTCTKDKTKISNIEAAIGVFDKYLDDFDTEHRARRNNPYLSLGVVSTCLRTAEQRGLDVEHQRAFIAAYSAVGGEYKKLRTVAEQDGGRSWDIVRNTALDGLKQKFADSKLFNQKDEPTDDHLQLLLWAYSPEAAKVKKVIPETKPEVKENRKRKSSVQEESSKKSKD